MNLLYSFVNSKTDEYVRIYGLDNEYVVSFFRALSPSDYNNASNQGQLQQVRKIAIGDVIRFIGVSSNGCFLFKTQNRGFQIVK